MADAYVDGLKLAAGRELSEAQVRQRLRAARARRGRHRRRGRPPDAKSARSTTPASPETIARTETSTKRRGKLRVRMQIEHAGISPATARKAVDDVFGELDADALLDAALDAAHARPRARSRTTRSSSASIGTCSDQGFDADERVLSALRARRRRTSAFESRPPSGRRRYNDRMTSNEIRSSFLPLLREERPPRRPELVARPGRRPDAAVHERRDEPVQGHVPRPREARLHARDDARRSACGSAASTTISTTSDRRCGITRSSRCSGTSRSATTSRRTRSASRGCC